MSDESDPDLRLVVRMLKQVTNDTAALRDHMNVMAATVTRMDHTLRGLTDEVRATHSQHGRLANRVRDLETASNEKLAP